MVQTPILKILSLRSCSYSILVSRYAYKGRKAFISFGCIAFYRYSVRGIGRCISFACLFVTICGCICIVCSKVNKKCSCQQCYQYKKTDDYSFVHFLIPSILLFFIKYLATIVIFFSSPFVVLTTIFCDFIEINVRSG